MSTLMLKDLLNWEEIMAAPRSAGGHTQIMDVLFKNCQVLADWREDDYQGNIGYAYLVYGWTDYAKIVVLTDSFGSCSGCDAWEDTPDVDVRNLCVQLANNAHGFDSIEDALAFLEMEVPKSESTYWDLRTAAAPLAQGLRKKLEEIKKKGL